MDIPKLKALMCRLFEDDALKFMEMGNYGISFAVGGKAKDVAKKLFARTDQRKWDGEASDWFYADEAADWDLYLKSSRGVVFCMASVRSLHDRYMDQYRLTPEQKAEIAADEERRRQDREGS